MTREGQEVSLCRTVKGKSWSAVGEGVLERWACRAAEPRRVPLKPESEVRPREEEELAGSGTSACSGLALPGSSSCKRLRSAPRRTPARHMSLNPPIDLCSEYCLTPISQRRTSRLGTCSLPRTTQLVEAAELESEPRPPASGPGSHPLGETGPPSVRGPPSDPHRTRHPVLLLFCSLHR